MRGDARILQMGIDDGWWLGGFQVSADCTRKIGRYLEIALFHTSIERFYDIYAHTSLKPTTNDSNDQHDFFSPKLPIFGVHLSCSIAWLRDDGGEW